MTIYVSVLSYTSCDEEKFPLAWKLGTCSNMQAYQNGFQYHENCCLIPGAYIFSWEHKDVNMRACGAEAFFQFGGHSLGDGIQDYKGAQVINILGQLTTVNISISVK